MSSAHQSTGDSAARERILDAAYELFARNGVRAVGIDRIIEEAGVAKTTLYRHFPSKADLVLAFLDLREQRWTRGLLETGMVGAWTPRERLLGLFDSLDEWFERPDFEGCSFVNTLLEFHEANDPIHTAASRHLDVVKDLIRGQLESAGAPDPDLVASQLQVLMLGAIVSAGRGDLRAAGNARPLAELLLESHGLTAAAEDYSPARRR